MPRIAFISLLVLLTSLLILRGRLLRKDDVLPAFQRTDAIAGEHRTRTSIKVHTKHTPAATALEGLEKDYTGIWAHLNHLYATNDVTAGKEYYTEAWFRQCCNQYPGIQKPVVTREDVQHELHIQQWADDGLVCTAIDSNVVFRYHYPDQSIKTTKANIAVVLLYQGDHWRIDAIHIINETIN